MEKEKKTNVPLTHWEINNLYFLAHWFAVQNRKQHTELTLFTKEEEQDQEAINKNLNSCYIFGKLEEALEPYIDREYLEENDMI